MKKKKVLIIDDDKEFLEELKEMLTSKDYDVTGETNAILGLEMIRDLQPDVIVLDLKLKEASGFQIADKLSLSAETNNIPIIAITGFFTKREHSIIMNLCGIKKHLIKPFKPEELIEEIESVTGKNKRNA